MNNDIKDIRRKTKMSQSEFAELYGIPVSTLRKWEQGIASPPDYVINLIVKNLPSSDDSVESIEGRDGNTYYYDAEKSVVMDGKGNSIAVYEDLDGVKPNNLRLYVSELFEDFYEIQEKFERDCRYDKEEDINWI